MTRHRKTWKNSPARRASIVKARHQLSLYVRLGKHEYQEHRKR